MMSINSLFVSLQLKSNNKQHEEVLYIGLDQWNTYLARKTSHPGDDILVYPLYAISNIH